MSDFRRALLGLPDDAFYEIVRNYLGPIHTPFNKHDLIRRVEAFLRRERTQRRIVELLDEEDALTLSAVRFLGEPGFDELLAFLSRPGSYLRLHQHLLNLEERLLVCRVAERVRVNPILERPLDAVIGPHRLFPSRPAEGEPTPAWPEAGLLAAFCGLLDESPELVRADGSLRKRARETLENRLPALLSRARRPADAGEEEAGTAPRAVVLHRALSALGIAGPEGVSFEAAESLAARSSLDRTALLAAAYVAGPAAPDSAPNIGGALADACAALPADRAFEPAGLERLLGLLTGGEGRLAREAMILFGLFSEERDGFCRAARPPDGGTEADDRSDGNRTGEEPRPAPLVVEGNFEVAVPPGTPLSEALFVARVGRLLRHERYSRYELDRRRFAGALRSGLAGSAVAPRLERLAAGRLPRNVVVSLESWTREFESVRVYSGIVLAVGESREHLLRHDAVARLIARRLARGVCLVEKRDLPALEDALEAAGVDPPPRLAATSPERHPAIAPASEEQRRRTRALLAPLERPGSLAAPLPSGGAHPLEELRHELSRRSLPADQREELAARVERKLILRPEQLASGALRTEKTEARGLDYVGKVRIVEQALRDAAWLLEVIERAPDGSPRRRLIAPSGLARREEELLLAGEELPARTPVEIPVSKLALVRRIRQGLVKRRPSP